MADRRSFPTDDVKSTPFNKLLKPAKKNVAIKGEFDFSGGGLKIPDQKIENHQLQKQSKTHKRGRPVSITDPRFKVQVPKKISPALNTKLAVLEEYITELQSVKGRITFEEMINALADAYVTKSLGVAKEEHFKDELNGAMNDLKRNFKTNH